MIHTEYDIQKLSTAFKYYRDTVFEVEKDLRFWEPFLQRNVSSFLEEDWVQRQPMLFSSAFNAYNSKNGGQLTMEKKVDCITKESIQKDRRNFFIWVENLSCLRLYNALELFLMQAIHLRYFPTYENPFNDKKATDKIINSIRFDLEGVQIKADKTNNKFLIDFLKMKSTKVSNFLGQRCNSTFQVTWGNIFVLISTLRNLIAHHNSILNLDILNNINSKCKDVFEFYFEVEKIDNRYIILRSRSTELFLTFKSYFDDFILNVVREIFEEEDFTFFDLPAQK